MIHHSSDRQFPLPAGSVRLHGIIDTKIRLVADGVLKTIDMHALADYFRLTRDMFATGEFWGKIMRASCLIASYTGDEQLLHIIDTAVPAPMRFSHRERTGPICGNGSMY